MTVGCVVMAAGEARRFGKNKLLVDFQGKTLIARALDAVPTECETAVVTQYDAVASLAAARGFSVVKNDRADLGISHTVALGLRALSHCDGVLFLAADQPRLTRESVSALVDFWREAPDQIAALSHGGVRGNPALFPARFYGELLALTGDVGGAQVIRRHESELRLLEVPERELADADTPGALKELE